MKNYSNQLKLAPFALMIMLIVAGVQKCNEDKTIVHQTTSK